MRAVSPSLCCVLLCLWGPGSDSKFSLSSRLEFRRYLPDRSFRNFRGITLIDCAEECVSRQRCGSMNFNRKYSLCDLNEHTATFTETELVYSFDCVFGLRQNWTGIMNTTGCDEACSYNQKCSWSQIGVTCSTEECLAPSKIMNGRYRGNKWSVGMTVKYECYPGYNFTGSQSRMTCNSDGNWTAINPGCESGTETPTCEAGWHRYEQTCVLLVRTKMTWEQAEANCVGLSANLITIKNRAKNDFVKSLVRSPVDSTNYWLGATKDAGWQSLLNWVDGTAEWYRPNPLAPGDGCLLITDLLLGWWTPECSLKMFSICEKSLYE